MSRSRKIDMYKDSEGKGNWIKGSHLKTGALHRELQVPLGKKIPAGKLSKALHSKSPLSRKRANLAKTLESFHH
jgi:hypothetical protein